MNITFHFLVLRCGIFGFCLLSFPQTERKIHKLRQLSSSRGDGDISWTRTSRGHYFSKWGTSRGHSQRVTFRDTFGDILWTILVKGTLFSARLG